jgi:hypothetical protein
MLVSAWDAVLRKILEPCVSPGARTTYSGPSKSIGFISADLTNYRSKIFRAKKSFLY